METTGLVEQSLEKRSSNEITPWVEYFVKTTLDAQIEAEAQIDFTLKTTRFFGPLQGSS